MPNNTVHKVKSVDGRNPSTNKVTTPALQLATITPPVATVIPSVIPPTSQSSSHHDHDTATSLPEKKTPNDNNTNNINNSKETTVDFIGPSKALRHLFSLPYSTDRNVSVALHTMGNGTILLDSGEDVSGGNSNSSMMFHNNEENPSPRPGRRRRPRSWSTDDNNSNNHHHPSLENYDDEKEKQHQLLVQNQQDEKSLLASLSLLLEEERQMEKVRNEKNHGVVAVDKRANVIGDELSKGSTSTALVHPQTTLVRQESCSEDTAVPVIERNSTVFSQTIQHQHQQKPPVRSNEDPDDMLADKLHPPTHYLRHVVTPPTEPNQYLHWNFKGMNVLVASDANIYSHTESSNNDHTADNLKEHDNTKSIVVKVADTSDLKSQMECHQSMRRANTIIPNIEEARKALPPSSYAEALLKDKEEENYDASSCNVTLQTSIIPSFNMGNQFAEYGFSISPSQSIDDFKNSAVSNPIMDNAQHSLEQPTVNSTASSQEVPYSSTPCCTVMDTYLDNIMANVPQLALILRQNGFISNIKLMQTEDIPYLLMHPSTFDGSASYPDSTPEPIFSPEIVEMNAAMLLRFLKTNCTKENSTYLLHRSAGEPNLQLFDISSISQLRQRKWIWWLALCSYRFACRLEQLQTNVLSPHDKATRREYRKRQRSLLHNTLDLLQELADMDGGRHETIGAAVYEHLADTYLWNDEADGEIGLRDPNKPAPLASLSHPYGKVTVDCLNKAQDHLTKAIGVLSPLLLKAKEDKSPIELEAISLQLYGIHHKLINVCLRLADNHLQSYFSSNLIQSLRTASRMLSDATDLLTTLNLLGFDKSDEATPYTESVLLQYSWLWEYCGHFARSFSADKLWRERGHTCGNDLLSLFREVDSICCGIIKNCLGHEWKTKSIVETASHGQVSLKSLTGIVVLPDDFEQIERSVLQKKGCHEAISTAKSLIYQKSEIKRDECLVLAAATLCYSNAIDGQRLAKQSLENEAAPSLLFQRLGDACNEIGQILLQSSRQVIISDLPHDVAEKSHVSAIMLTSAQFWFVEGLEQFNVGNDLRNIALLRCNLCQVCKIRANSNVVLPGSANGAPNESEHYLQQAVDHLVLAHESMGQRETDQRTWDMVSEELAATLLVLGVRRRQSSLAGLSSSSNPLTMNALRPAPGVEKSIVDPMERACKIYESLGTARSAQQAAAAHYQLAIYYSKIWTCQRDESKTREKLAAAFNHFGIAHGYYSFHSEGNEPTFVCLSLDFSNLYSSVSDREDPLTKALTICLDCRKAFISDSIASMRTKPNSKEWFSQMSTLSTNIQDRVSKLLLSLVKIEKGRDEDKYKSMYRQVLSHKVMTSEHDSLDRIIPDSFAIYDLLESLANCFDPSNIKN